MLRTNTCGELSGAHAGKKVVLCGWVQARRDHGGVLFIDLRDSFGVSQVVCDPSHSSAVHGAAEKVGREFVLRVSGKVRRRPEGMVNPGLSTGEVEVLADGVEVLNSSELPPIEVDDRVVAGDELRLKYRYLDLRRPVMQHNLRTRHVAAQVVRRFLDANGFTEVETPLLIKHTPEGARDYIVPSRIHPGRFYSLPQSPQLYKQLLVMSGVDRYYQLARCLRDEDLRQDRQPEFTQIDMELAFVEEEDIYSLVEALLKELWGKVRALELKTPFPRLTYRESMERFGSDRPDTRFGLELVDVTEIVADSGFSVFLDAIKRGGIVKCINAVGCADFSRKDIDELTQFVAVHGAKGLAWMKVGESLEGSIVKYFGEDVQKRLVEAASAKKGDLLLFVADREKAVFASLGNLRVEIARRLGMIDESAFRFLWVTDFPLLEFDEEEQRFVAMHHPFTAPKQSDVHLLASKPGNVCARAYDITLNGVEVGGGSIRNNRPDTQSRVFEALGISEKEASGRFGFLLDALRFGAPPHGGIALGFDRIVALLCGTHDIREVIAFPKNKKAENPMDGCPSSVDAGQLKELHLSVKE